MSPRGCQAVADRAESLEFEEAGASGCGGASLGRTAIAAVHDDYLAAGANVATAATYQASFASLRTREFHDAQAAAVFEAAMRLARDAFDRAASRRAPHGPRPLAIALLGRLWSLPG